VASRVAGARRWLSGAAIVVVARRLTSDLLVTSLSTPIDTDRPVIPLYRSPW
jgi:hypothetical protein